MAPYEFICVPPITPYDSMAPYWFLWQWRLIPVTSYDKTHCIIFYLSTKNATWEVNGNNGYLLYDPQCLCSWGIEILPINRIFISYFRKELLTRYCSYFFWIVINTSQFSTGGQSSRRGGMTSAVLCPPPLEMKALQLVFTWARCCEQWSST